jgi:hypothetical protein
LDVNLTKRAAGWVSDFTFPFTGQWTLALSVETEDSAAVLTGGTLEIG